MFSRIIFIRAEDFCKKSENFFKKYWKIFKSVVSYRTFQIMDAGPIIPAVREMKLICYLVRKKVTTCKTFGKN